MFFNLGDLVYVRDWKDHGKHRIICAYENFNKIDTYTIDDLQNTTWEEWQLVRVEERHTNQFMFKKEFDLGDTVLSSVNHVRTYGKIISKIYTINTKRIQYRLDNGLTFYASHLRLCEGGV